MSTITMEIPEEIAFDLKIPKERWNIELRKELALQRYREKLLSFGNARRLAGMKRLDFHYLLEERKIPRYYDIEDYEQDMEALEQWDEGE